MPAPDDDHVTLWRELRSWPRTVQYGAAGLALAMIGATFALAPLHSPDFPGRSAWPEGELPQHVESEPTTDTPEAASDLPAGISLYGGEPDWVAENDEDTAQIAHIDQGELHRTDGKLELQKDGTVVWSYTWEEFGPEIGIGEDVVVISKSPDDFTDDDYEWPGREDTVALDLDTGEEVWHDQEASFVSVFSDAVLMTECTGKQENHIGDCTLYARHPTDLRTLWSVPTYASAQAETGSSWTGTPLPERLLVASYPTGHSSRTVTVYEHGRALTSVATHGKTTLAGDTLVVYDDYDDNPADGCTASLAGHRFGQTDPAWQIEAMTRKTADYTYCGSLPASGEVDGKLPLTIDGVPSIVDLETGESIFEALTEGQALAIDPEATTLIVLDWDAGEDTLAAYDTATGTERWRASTAFGSGDRATVIGSTLWLYGDAGMWGWSSYTVYAYDLATGEGVALPGTVAYFLPGQIVTDTGDYDETILKAWPADLW
ncbi:hypothetical protein AB0B28_12220 [Glycomyces sp. NPDC046736]|uniref:hypothetical protein n=1 Tax=Glycomyces sp. NPDC046736 TaxID=3155615 RepID=UPI0033DBDA7E